MFTNLEVEIGEINFMDELALAREKQLKSELGNIFCMVPRKIHAIQQCPETGEPLYLCSWQQDFSEVHYLPSWVQSRILGLLQYQNLIVDFYENFLPKIQVQSNGVY